MSVQDSDWSDVNQSDVESVEHGNDWDVLSQSSNVTDTDASRVSHALNHVNIVVSGIGEDTELPILPLSALTIDEKKEENCNENCENGENRDGNNGVSFIASYVDITAELERQRQIVENLRQSLHQANERNNILEEKNNQLNNIVTRLSNENNQLRHLRFDKKFEKRNGNQNKKQRKSEIMALMQPKNGSNKKGGKYHKNAIPAKLKFRRQRSTFRSVCTSSRGW